MNKFIFLAALALVGLLVILWLLPRSGSGPSQPESMNEVYTEVQTGSFAIAQGGVHLGEERYTLGRSSRGSLRLNSRVQLSVRDVKLALVQDLRLTGDLRPLFYSLTATTPQGQQKITAVFRDGQAVVTAQGGGLNLQKKFTADDGFVVLDNNLASQLLIIYELIKHKQKFRVTALVPQALLTLPLQAERARPVKLQLGEPGVKHEIEAEHFVLRLGDTRFEIYAAEGRLIGAQFPGQAQIYRDDLYPGGFKVLQELNERPRKLPPGVREEDVRFTSDGVELAGSLVLPVQSGARKPVPAVLLIAGSGPVDRDENAPGLQVDIFNTIAYRLAQDGIASLRYDKRGVGASTGEFRKASLSDLVADARAALDYLRSRPEIDPDKLFLLGHSEGGIIAPLVATAPGVRVAGLILIAAPAHPLDWIILKQIERIDRSLGLPEEQIERDLERERQFIAFVKASKGDWDNYTLQDVQRWIPGLTELEFEGYKAISLRWYREHFAHDPLQTIKEVRVPVMIIQGDKDIQVPSGEARLLAQALRAAGNKAVELHLLPDLNHLLRRHPEEPNIAYRHLDESVDARVLDLISAWLGRRATHPVGGRVPAVAVLGPVKTDVSAG